MIENVKGQLEEMANDPLYDKYAYVTYDDIKQLNRDNDQTLLAIRAPRGSRLEIIDADPEEEESMY